MKILLLASIIFIPIFFGVAQTTARDVNEISILQEQYKQKHGRYLQIQKGNKLPPHEAGSEKLKKDLPSNYLVDVYDGPKGKGYIVRWKDAAGFHVQGYGPHADDYTEFFPLNVATST
jgi:hypothetical protein